MRSVKWYLRRLKAMSAREISWRINQKYIQKNEIKEYYEKHLSVTKIPYRTHVSTLVSKEMETFMELDIKNPSLFSNLDLFNGTFSYQKFQTKWNAGFQTEKKWPENVCSYNIECGGREDIGDIRTNWELNRHYQFSCLAKSYYVSLDESYLKELKQLFEDWNKHNLFLHGAEWTSTMEVAIRVNSWCFTYCFLKMAQDKQSVNAELVENTDLGSNISELLADLKHGILVMADYVTNHYSRFSSANNHLIVELYSVALVGIIFDIDQWKSTAIEKLTNELYRQNFSDGVNKEMSLHYQAFVMEAYGLLAIILKRQGDDIPQEWYQYLIPMSRFVADCHGTLGETIVFGDSDEGKILDLNGKKFDYYKYILDLMGLILPERYTELDDLHENLKWLTSDNLLKNSKSKPLYGSPSFKCYREGGYSFIRDNGILIGIDHADLGFGKLAAHGHADALSFQMFLDGEPIFVDSGSPNYHIPRKGRDVYRSAYCHNTVTIDGKNQSEILGPFMWGDRASVQLIEASEDRTGKVTVEAEAKYRGIIHHRKFEYLSGELLITDTFHNVDEKKKEQVFLFPQLLELRNKNNNEFVVKETEKLQIKIINISNAVEETSEYIYSAGYNQANPATRIVFRSNDNMICSSIKVLVKG